LVGHSQASGVTAEAKTAVIAASFTKAVAVTIFASVGVDLRGTVRTDTALVDDGGLRQVVLANTHAIEGQHGVRNTQNDRQIVLRVA